MPVAEPHLVFWGSNVDLVFLLFCIMLEDLTESGFPTADSRDANFILTMFILTFFILTFFILTFFILTFFILTNFILTFFICYILHTVYSLY